MQTYSNDHDADFLVSFMIRTLRSMRFSTALGNQNRLDICNRNGGLQMKIRKKGQTHGKLV